MSYFLELGLAEPITRALGTKGYSDPTPIQRQAIPPLLQGRDLLGIAQTGTGKTAAFSLPSLHLLASSPKPRQAAACRMLVLSPTRELAAQIADNMRGYARYLDLNIQCIFGGVPAGKQARALVPGCDVLVATPGRLLDLLDQRALTLRHVEIFVLDEADQMMDLGFIQPLKRISNLLPKERQSLFFSATMPKAIAELGKQFINNPVRVEVAPQSTTAERVDQLAIFVNQAEKQALLTIKLRTGLADSTIDRALVFTRTKHGADRVVRHLSVAGVSAAAIHGNKSQGQRTAAIHGFRSGTVRVLVATDIAARGIDIPGVSHVFNFEIPNVPEQYVHRIGRTARAGADGIAESFVAPDEQPYLRDIERLTGVKLVRSPLPEDFLKEAARLPLPARKPEHAEGAGNRQNRGRGPRQDGERARTGQGERNRSRSQPQRPRRDDEAQRSARADGWKPFTGDSVGSANAAPSQDRGPRSAQPQHAPRRQGEPGAAPRRPEGERSARPDNRQPHAANRRSDRPSDSVQRPQGDRARGRQPVR